MCFLSESSLLPTTEQKHYKAWEEKQNRKKKVNTNFNCMHMYSIGYRVVLIWGLKLRQQILLPVDTAENLDFSDALWLIY